MITAPLFGLAPTYTLAVVFRSLSGLFNGNIGVAKAYAREICDDTNSSKIFSYLGFAWGMGVMIGPTLGGVLSHPDKHFPYLFSSEGFWRDHPYFLPMFVKYYVYSSVISFVGLIIGFFVLEDSKRQPSKRRKVIWSLFYNQTFVICAVVYAISGLAFLGFQEVFPFFCKARRRNGGLGWVDEGNIGLVQSSGGLSVIFFQVISI